MRVRFRLSRAASLGVFAVTIASAIPARADEASRQARADYDAGATAYQNKDYANAAALFARADERVPNPRALQLAMAAALASGEAHPGKGAVKSDSGDAALAMDLVERAETRAVDGSLAQLAQRLRKRFAGGAGKIRLVCPVTSDAAKGGSPSDTGKSAATKIACRAKIDDGARELEDGGSAWANVGHHVVHVRGGADADAKARTVDRDVSVAAGAAVDVSPRASEIAPPEAPPAAPVPDATARAVQPPPEILPEHHAKGVSPVIFWTSLGVTAVAAGTATVFTVITKQKHDDFVTNPSQTTADDGESSQTRARIAWGITGAFAATTIVVAALTDWKGSSSVDSAAPRRASVAFGAGAASSETPRSERVSLAVGPGSLFLSGRFR